MQTCALPLHLQPYHACQDLIHVHVLALALAAQQLHLLDLSLFDYHHQLSFLRPVHMLSLGSGAVQRIAALERGCPKKLSLVTQVHHHTTQACFLPLAADVLHSPPWRL